MGNIGNTKNDYEYWRFKPNNSINLTASGTVKLTDGLLTGWFVSEHSAATLKFWNSAAGATGTVLIHTTAATTGVTVVPETYFSNGLFVTLTTTGTMTVFYK